MIWEPDVVEAGLIATGVTLIGILITNQAKVSEFRQKWIDALRDDAATLITHTLIVHAASAEDDIDESYTQIHQTTARIRLRLNPEEDDTTDIISAMNEMRNANHYATDFDDLNERANIFTVAVQKVLKKEWERVKWGEPLYRWVFVLVIVGMLLSLGIIFYRIYPWAFYFASALK
jgi:hypothetical protein